MWDFHVLTSAQQEVLERIAEVLPTRHVGLADNSWRTLEERLRASEIELDELTNDPSWERLMSTRFFDYNGDYFHPLLFIREGARVNNFLIDNRPNFVRVWLRYHLPQTVLQWDMVCVDVKRISESEALGLEVRNEEVIERVDAILSTRNCRSPALYP